MSQEHNISPKELEQNNVLQTVDIALKQDLSKRRDIPHKSIFPNNSFVTRRKKIPSSQKDILDIAKASCQLEYSRSENIIEILSHTKIQYSKICLDIGFGTGENIIEMAKLERDTLFIGIETYQKGVFSLLSRILSNHISNILLFDHDAIPILLHMIPSHSISRIQIFFPDPWPKTRHHKRRLIQYPFLVLAHQILELGAKLWLITDWEQYAHSIQDLLAHFIEQKKMYRIVPTEENLLLQQIRCESRFERKGKEKGHQIFSLLYQTTAN